jgi:myosin heavy subunit
MSRLGIDYTTVKMAAINLLSQGIAPSVQKIREVLGTGSNTTIASHLKTWRDEYAKQEIHLLPADMPKELISAFSILWQTAMDQAQCQLAEYKKTLEKESTSARQIQQDAEKLAIDLKQQLSKMSAQVELEITEKQKAYFELTVANDRLTKREIEINTQKIKYEDRLKRTYAEKDSVISDCQLHQDQIKMLQGKLELSAKQNQDILIQQSTLHEQSENRWLSLIAQARHETKDANKKLDLLRKNSEEQLKKQKQDLSDLRENLYEKNTQLKAALEQIKQLKQASEIGGRKNIKSKSTIIKLQDRQHLKNASKK